MKNHHLVKDIDCSILELPFEEGVSEVYKKIDTHCGAVFSSGFDYPGRHTRWEVGFVDPSIELSLTNRTFTFQLLDSSAAPLLPLFFEKLKSQNFLEGITLDEDKIVGHLKARDSKFSEEERLLQPSIFLVLREIKNIFLPFVTENSDLVHLGFYGAVGYDLVLQFEDLKLSQKRDANQKILRLFLPLNITVVDRKKETAKNYNYLINTAFGTAFGSESNQVPAVTQGDLQHTSKTVDISSEPDEIQCDHLPGEFAKKIEQVIKGTEVGNYFEVVLSQEFKKKYSGKPSVLFQTLAVLNPSPYMFLLNFGEEQLIGASPELYARVNNGRYETCPIAGTIRRGKTAIEDAKSIKELINSSKDESELTMCTDVDRNDMARVCVPGSVKVIGRRQLEIYSHLIHTVDHLEGQLCPQYDSLDAFQTHMWACTVTGAPKPAALQEIENLEKSPRGWYSGAVTIYTFDGNLNTGITLRAATLKNGYATIRAGATLLYYSNPEDEEQETRTKAAAFFSAIRKAEEQASAKNSLPKSDTAKQKQSSLNKKILLVDCKDSFVHNLSSYLQYLGASVVTYRANFAEEAINSEKPDLVLLSPGPGSPEEFGIPNLVGLLAQKQIPTFGVCLGHQGIGQFFGATLKVLPTPYHGQESLVEHSSPSVLFKDIATKFFVGRYHSLYLEEQSLPKCLKMTAWVEHPELGKIPMALEHQSLPIYGVQFHPESLMTLVDDTGEKILLNVLNTLC